VDVDEDVSVEPVVVVPVLEDDESLVLVLDVVDELSDDPPPPHATSAAQKTAVMARRIGTEPATRADGADCGAWAGICCVIRDSPACRSDVPAGAGNIPIVELLQTEIHRTACRSIDEIERSFAPEAERLKPNATARLGPCVRCDEICQRPRMDVTQTVTWRRKREGPRTLPWAGLGHERRRPAPHAHRISGRPGRGSGAPRRVARPARSARSAPWRRRSRSWRSTARPLRPSSLRRPSPRPGPCRGSRCRPAR